jgi:ribosomal protein S18 acetylase RimI-like enzyme
MIIEQARPEDAAAILALQKLAYLSEALIYGDFTIPPLVQTLDETVAEFTGRTVLKATDNGEIIGSVRAHMEQGTCHIGKLIVHPERQNRGLGTRLLAAIEGHFRQAVRFELFTGHRSRRNLHLYHRCGYHNFRREKVSPALDIVFLEKENRQERLTPPVPR